MIGAGSRCLIPRYLPVESPLYYHESNPGVTGLLVTNPNLECISWFGVLCSRGISSSAKNCSSACTVFWTFWPRDSADDLDNIKLPHLTVVLVQPLNNILAGTPASTQGSYVLSIYESFQPAVIKSFDNISLEI